MAMRVGPCLKPCYAKRGLYERFQKAVADLGWKRSGEKVVLGLSGGRDSVVLLHLLLVSGHRVIAAHLNHQLRGKESERDEKFIRELCCWWKVPIWVRSENVAQKARRYKLSREEAARIARYRFLLEVARQKKARNVLVAHHQRDQAETILLKIFRGCTRSQIHGMKMVRPLPHLNWRKTERHLRQHFTPQLIRPLLQAPISEIALYAKQNRLVFQNDSSNQDLTNPRNWIRHRLLPLIEKRLNRNVTQTLVRLG